MFSTSEDCDDCSPASLGRRSHASTTVVFSSLPFIVTFLLIATIVLQKLFPLLSDPVSLKTTDGPQLPYGKQAAGTSRPTRPSIKRASAWIFSATIALAAVLAELILCEISNTIDPTARRLALRITVTLLLLLLVIAIPLLELHSLITFAGYKYTGSGKGRLRIAWVLHIVGFTAWLLGFWWVGTGLLGRRELDAVTRMPQSLSESCLERVGVIGISLMALLSGFAAVSSPWQNFGARPKPITEADVERKRAGLEATNDMLSAKRSRLRALEQKMSMAPSEGFFKKAIGSIRGNADTTERQALLLEISGLETMALSLSSSLSMYHTRLHQQQRARTAIGRLLLTVSYGFSVYCLYRILTTSLTAVRRWLSSSNNVFTGSDPINNILALLAKHYDPHLDQAAWARQISFLLSGVILFASFSSVLQTFHLFARFTPSLLRAAQANLPLVVAQVCATYVISSALLLRGMMPGEVVGDGLKGLGGTEMGWVDWWFEGWFLGGVTVTALGIWVGRQIGGLGDWDDDERDVELGKRS